MLALAMSLCMIFTMMPMAAHATEIQETYTVYLNSSGGSGTLSGDGSYAVGTTVTITATPIEGSCFYMWGGGNGAALTDYTTETTTFTMPANDVTITANFRTHSESWGYTEDEHYKTCLFCGEVAGTRASHSYTDDTDTECECGWIREVHTHEYSDATCTTPATCSCNATQGDVDKNNHVGGTEVRNKKDATETEDGYTGDTYCLGCGDVITYGITIPATGGEDDGDDDDTHTHDYTAVVTAPTCSAQGYTTYTCSCNDSYVGDYVDALGHDWGNYISNGNGSHTRICTTDNSHHQTEDCGGTATCHTLAYCSDCQTSYGTYDATNHSGGTEIRNAKDATKTENGYTGDTYCVGCGDKLADGETIPATGGEDDDDTHTHNYRNEHDDTHHWKECSSCGDISDRGKHTPGVAATCHSLAECADCKMPYGDLDITNHKYLSYVEYEAGHRLLCVCGRLDDVAEMEPHIYTNDKDRSCNICGYERKIHAHRYTISTCTTAGVCSCGATTGVNPNNHTGGTEIRNAAEATIVAEGYTGDTYCLGCGSKIASGEVIPKAGVIFDGPGVEDVTFIPAAGTELPEDAVVIVEDHTPSADDLAFLALPETTDPSVRYAVVPEDWIGSMDAAVIGPDGGRYIRHEKLLINGKEYYVSGGDDGESLSLYDKEGNIYSYDGEKEPQVIGQNAGTEYPENKFIEINGAIYQIHSVQRDTDGNETLILYLDGKPAGMCQFDQYEEMNLIINIYNDDYHPAKVKASQQLSGYVGTVTTGENPIDGLESGKTYNVSVIGSQDISVPGAENVTGTITQTFAVPDALIGNKNVVYAAVHKTASGNEIGEVTLSEDGKTLTATYTVSSFSPFTIYAFVEADEPEIKAIITESDAPITRADFVMLLWNKAGAPVTDFLMQFTDVPQDVEYTEAIRWAAANKIVLGNGDGTFAPEDALTREEMAVILHRYAQYCGIDVSVGENTNILSYEDSFDISSWAIPAIQWACGAGLMQDEDGYIKPQADVIRKEAWEMLLAVTEDE